MIKVFDASLNYIGFLDIFNSFQCSQCYADAGSFSIKAILSQQTVELLQVGNFIQYGDFAGMIDSVQKEESDKTDLISASGYDLTGILNLRIIWDNLYFNGNSEEFLRRVVDVNAINPADAARKIPLLELGTLSGLPQTTERNTSNETLLEECKKVCSVADYGFSVTLEPREKKMYFNVYAGEDRTAGQPRQVVLGKDYDNVATQDYIYSTAEVITTCLVTAETTSVTVGGDAAGFNRKEAVIQSSQQQEELSLEQFQNVLLSEGKAKLQDKIECFDIDICNVSLAVGDVVTVRDRKWGINFNTRVTEKQITVENGEVIITYLLGNDVIREVSK